MATIFRLYDLEMAHRLNAGVPQHHKCRRLHGHRYQLTIWVSGELDGDGMLIEYDDLDRVVGPVLGKLDHNYANELPAKCSTPEAEAVAANPTVERLADWLGARLPGIVASAVRDRKLRLSRLTIQEDARAGAEWTASPPITLPREEPPSR